MGVFGRLVCVLSLVFLATVRGPAALGELREAYPLDAPHAQALAACASADPNFDRLSEAERAGCFVRLIRSYDPSLAPNFVDLRRAAGRGRMPRSDIVEQQQLARYLQARSAILR